MSIGRKLLVLDLDETLIRSFSSPLPFGPPHAMIVHYHMYRRPHVDTFLRSMASCYDLAVWTSASPAYAREVIAASIPSDLKLEFVYTAEQCESYFDDATGLVRIVKELARLGELGRDLRDIVVIDDIADTFSLNSENGVLVAAFDGDPEDEELLRLEPFLLHLANLPDVRTEEKRGWRGRVERRRDDGSCRYALKT